ncbi:excinuclease ABC subunit UvrC [bacterium]|nr:excinuclease ABC subunit UvrC [bacterium]
MNEMLQNKLDSLPQVPGVYKFLNEKGEILYIGKAVRIGSRVNSYFKEEMYDRPRVRQMMPLVRDLEIVETNNEVEALVLESALIKKYKPKYNSDLKDDKSYAWIYVSTKEDFPTVKIVRSTDRKEYKKGRLFGPYPSGLAVKRVFTYLRKLYPFCTCSKNQKEPCLNFHLGLCPGPYQGKISKEDYRVNINEIVKFLNGRKKGQLKEMRKEMKQYSKEKKYEKAAEVRDRVKDLEYLGQNIEFNYHQNESNYKARRVISRNESFEELAMELDIDNLNRIECYDISNMQGKHAYGSMVVSVEGNLSRSQYRIFKIRGKDTPDDPAMLKEVLQRRLRHIGKDEDESLCSKPDIVLLDGAKSQLGVVKKYIDDDIVLMGISKGKYLKRAGLKKRDEFWIVRDGEIYSIDLVNPALLIDLRDEAHRFAITHYRKRAIKEGKRSVLEKIPGIGEKRRGGLIKKFKNIENIKKASVEEIDEVIKNKKVSESVKNLLQDI